MYQTLLQTDGPRCTCWWRFYPCINPFSFFKHSFPLWHKHAGPNNSHQVVDKHTRLLCTIQFIITNWPCNTPHIYFSFQGIFVSPLPIFLTHLHKITPRICLCVMTNSTKATRHLPQSYWISRSSGNWMDIFMWMSLRRVDKGRSSWRRCCASHFCWMTREGSGCATRSWTPCDITDGMEKANLQSSPQLVSVSGNTVGLIEIASLDYFSMSKTSRRFFQ